MKKRSVLEISEHNISLNTTPETMRNVWLMCLVIGFWFNVFKDKEISLFSKSRKFFSIESYFSVFDLYLQKHIPMVFRVYRQKTLSFKQMPNV